MSQLSGQAISQQLISSFKIELGKSIMKTDTESGNGFTVEKWGLVWLLKGCRVKGKEGCSQVIKGWENPSVEIGLYRATEYECNSLYLFVSVSLARSVCVCVWLIKSVDIKTVTTVSHILEAEMQVLAHFMRLITLALLIWCWEPGRFLESYWSLVSDKSLEILESAAAIG